MVACSVTGRTWQRTLVYLSGSLDILDSRFHPPPAGWALDPPRLGLGGPESGPPGLGEVYVLIGGVDDLSQDPQAEVEDLFGHPQGVQVKAASSGF